MGGADHPPVARTLLVAGPPPGPLHRAPRAPMVFCKAGKRAAMAEQSLRALGYTDVTNAGGYHDIQSFDR